MALKLNVETFGKKDALGFRPADLIPNFAAFTGRQERTEDQIEKMVASLLLHGQEQPFTYRKGFDGKPIPVTGHTRIIAADRINQRGLTGANGVTYSNANPFVVYGLFKPFNEIEAVIHTFIENDDETRTALNDVDIAFLIRTLSETFGITDAEIATKLGKPASWVSNHRKVLELDHETQAALAAGDLKFDAALTAAAVEPGKRKNVIAKAKAENGGKATAAGIANAARSEGAKTSKKLPHSDADFKKWLRAKINETAVSPSQSFLFAILDYRSGAIGEAELNEAFAKLDAGAEVALSAAN